MYTVHQKIDGMVVCQTQSSFYNGKTVLHS